MTINQPLVSVLMTSYNREKYIGNAIESVLASTYQNFELIITDDGSKDRTVEIAQSYAAKDARVKVFINEKNLGDYPNRNKAASLAQGKYLKYVDADDYMYKVGLQVMVEQMEANPEAALGLCSFAQFIEKPFPYFLTPKQAYSSNFFGNVLFHKAPLSAIIKKDVFEQLDGFKPYRMVGDFEMWHRLALQFPILIMQDGVVWYREHNEQEVNSKKKYALVYEEIQKHYVTHPQCPLTKNEVANYLNRNKKYYSKIWQRQILRGKFDEAKQTKQIVNLYSNTTHKSLPEKIV